MPHNNEMEKLYPSDSPKGLGVLPCTTLDEAKKLEGYIQDWITLQNRNKWYHAVGWFRNLAFWQGNHYSQFNYRSNVSVSSDGNTFSITPISGAYQKYANLISRDIDNRCREAFEVPVGFLTKVNPQPRVTPNSDSPEDKKAAKLSEIAFKVLWEHPMRMPAKLREVAGFLVLYGLAAVEIEYRDTDVPLRIPKFRVEEYDDPDQEALLDGEKPLREVPDGYEVVFKRQMMADVWSPYHLIVDPAATADPESINWIMRRSFRDIGEITEEIQERAKLPTEDDEHYFVENLEGITPVKLPSDDCLYWYEEIKDVIDSPESLVPYVGRISSRNQEMIMNDTIYTVIDCKPNRHYPKGRTMIYAGEKLLYCGPARAWSEKYPERWHPYTIFRFWTVPERFWGASLFSDVVPLQKRLNKMDSLLKINQMFMTFGIYRIPKGSLTKDDNISHTPGIEINYLPIGNGLGPEKMKNEPLPSEILVEREFLIKAIRELAMVSRLFEQKNVSHLRTGVQLEMLQRETIENRSPTIMSFQDSIQHLAQNILIELNLNLEEEDAELTQRIRAAAREYSSLTVNNFVNTDLRDNVHIEIDIISALQTSPEADAQKALDYIGALQGQITPHERAKVLKKLRLDDFENPESKQIERAETMVSNIINGDINQAVPDLFLDDPFLFVEVFKDTLREERRYDRPQEVNQKLQEYAELYDRAAKEILRQQALLQAQAAEMGIKSDAKE